MSFLFTSSNIQYIKIFLFPLFHVLQLASYVIYLYNILKLCNNWLTMYTVSCANRLFLFLTVTQEKIAIFILDKWFTVAFLTTFATCFSVSDFKQISRAKGLQIFFMWFAFLSTPSFLNSFLVRVFKKSLKFWNNI